jgi:DNA-binding NarL/FixJ family response regulator
MLGSELIRRLVTNPDLIRPRIIAVASHREDGPTDDDILSELLYIGADGLLARETDTQTLAGAIRAVGKGDAILTPKMTRRLLDWYRRHEAIVKNRHQSSADNLTEREREVLMMTAKGRSTEEIAAELWISIATVRTHIYRLRNKLNLRDRAQLVSYAYQAGMMQVDLAEAGLSFGADQVGRATAA